ncbi:MAG: putative membrane protein [Paracoccaceae bacterium]|jgi:putative membrane protein
MADLYLWMKALHIMAVIAWMAGLLYLPRLFVYHAEQVSVGSLTDKIFQTMEWRLLKLIMNPAMVVTWICGLSLVVTPGLIDWSEFWPWIKAACVIVMTVFHMWLGQRLKSFVIGKNNISGQQYRIINEVPTFLMIIIVFSVIFKF